MAIQRIFFKIKFLAWKTLNGYNSARSIFLVVNRRSVVHINFSTLLFALVPVINLILNSQKSSWLIFDSILITTYFLKFNLKCFNGSYPHFFYRSAKHTTTKMFQHHRNIWFCVGNSIFPQRWSWYSGEQAAVALWTTQLTLFRLVLQRFV